MAASFPWTVLARDYAQEREAVQPSPTDATADHPLLPPKPKEIAQTPITPMAKPVAVYDPLSALADGGASDSPHSFADPLSANVAFDPLSAMTATATATTATTTGGTSAPATAAAAAAAAAEDDDGMSTFTPWAAKKNGILSKYTTSAKLTITTSFLSSREAPKVDKTKARLEQLEEDEEDSVQTMLNLSQQDYIKNIDDLQQQLITAWDADQRVKSLKIAIQNAKMLSDTKVPQFYPSKFVLITEILDTFGRLVYDRIHRKSTYIPSGSKTPQPLPEKFTPDMVNDVAKETCRNWFFKIASIRELVPRLYVEMAILKCYTFLHIDDYSSALERIASMVRGIGNPLVATYTRAYLCRKGMEVAPRLKKHLFTLFYDYAFTNKQMKLDHVQDFLTEYSLTYPHYLDLFTPAVDWILQCVAFQSPKDVLQTILDKYTQHCNTSIVLDSILTSFPPEYVSANAVVFTELIKVSDPVAYPLHQLYRTLGINLVLCAPPKDMQKTILRDIWKVLSKLENPMDFITCAEIYIEIPAKHFTSADVDFMLNDVINHITKDRIYEQMQSQLQSVVEKILTHVSISDVFSMDNFMPLLDLFTNPIIKVEVCKSIMQYFSRSTEEVVLTDLIKVNGIMYITKTLHDSINALTFEDEKRQIGELIMSFIRRVDYGKDFEQQLNFYVTARGSFTSLDVVLQFLVQSVCALVMKTHRIVKGQHTRKTAAFVRAAVGFCYITIPSLVSVWARLSLYLLAAQVALINTCIPQMEAFFKAIITLLADFPKLTDSELQGMELRDREPFLVTYLANVSSTLMVVPGHPQNGPFFLLKALLNAMGEIKWEGKGEGKLEGYMNVLAMLSAMPQKSLPYSVHGVELNDVLYDGDERYTAELDSISSTLLAEILTYLQATEGDAAASPKRGHVALLLFNRMCMLTNLSSSKLRKLTGTVYGIAQRCSLSPADKAFLTNTIVAVSNLRTTAVLAPDHKEALQMLAKELAA